MWAYSGMEESCLCASAAAQATRMESRGKDGGVMGPVAAAAVVDDDGAADAAAMVPDFGWTCCCYYLYTNGTESRSFAFSLLPCSMFSAFRMFSVVWCTEPGRTSRRLLWRRRLGSTSRGWGQRIKRLKG